MKANRIRFFACILAVLCIIVSIVIYFIYTNRKGENKQNIEVKYEKTSMITNFRLGVSSFDSINPHLTKNKDIIQITSLIFEPLLEITKDYNITNCLAKEWSKISDTSYIIKLKENVKWQDDTKFTAEDVKFTIDTIKKDKKSIYLENIKDIKNVEVIDEYTVKLELINKVPFFEYQLIFPILQKKQYENQNMQSVEDFPIGTGRYKITKMNEDILELTRNEKWHEIESLRPNIKTINIYIYETMGDIYNSFKLGNIDLVNTSNVNYEEYIGSLGYQKKQYPGREYDFLALNCESPVLKNIEVRQAIQKLINKEKIVSSLLENHAYVSNFPLDYGSYLLEGIDLYTTYSEDEASKILKDAGWSYNYGIWSKELEGRTRTLNFNLSVNKDNKQRLKVAKEIQSELKKFGIEINIQELSNRDYQKILKNHEYEIILTGVYSGYSPELNSFLGEGNLANYKNDDISSILNNICNINSEELMKQNYKKIFEIHQKEVPYIGLYRNQVVTAYGQSVRGDIVPNNYSVFYNFNEWYRQ